MRYVSANKDHINVTIRTDFTHVTALLQVHTQTKKQEITAVVVHKCIVAEQHSVQICVQVKHGSAKERVVQINDKHMVVQLITDGKDKDRNSALLRFGASLFGVSQSFLRLDTVVSRPGEAGGAGASESKPVLSESSGDVLLVITRGTTAKAAAERISRAIAADTPLQ
jgi:uncharacterized protein YggU (UPF0235/DUF167 family)